MQDYKWLLILLWMLFPFEILGQDTCEMPTDSWKFLGMQDTGITAFAVNKETPADIYLTAKSRLLKSENCGQSWDSTHTATFEEFNDIAVYPSSPDTLYVLEGKKLWRSEDNGKEFSEVGNLFGDISAEATACCLTIHPASTELMFLHEVGGMPVMGPTPDLLISRNNGENWYRISKDTLVVEYLMGVDPNDPGEYYVKGTIIDTANNKYYDRILKRVESDTSLQVFNVPVDSLDEMELFKVSGKQSGGIYVATSDTMYVSKDNGDSWSTFASFPDTVNQISHTTFYQSSALSYSLFFTTNNQGLYRVNMETGDVSLYDRLPVSNPNTFKIDGYSGVIYAASYNGGLFAKSIGEQTAVAENATLPTSVKLKQNYPNPFNPSTTISYQLPNASDVTLTVYNLIGQKVATLVDGKRRAGSHKVTFDADRLSSGVYIYRLKAGEYKESKKMLLVK